MFHKIDKRMEDKLRRNSGSVNSVSQSKQSYYLLKKRISLNLHSNKHTNCEKAMET